MKHGYLSNWPSWLPRSIPCVARCDSNECAGVTAVRAMALAEEIDR